MGLFDAFPLSNAYSVNLDWIIKKMRELEEYVKNVGECVGKEYQVKWIYLDNKSEFNAENDTNSIE